MQRFSIVLVGCLLSLVFSAQTVWATEVEDAELLLAGWQMEEANQLILELESAYPEAADTLYLRAKYDFFQGSYKKALDGIDEAIAASPRGHWQVMRDNISAVEKVTRNYSKHVSPKGYFEVYLEPGRDEVLLPFAFEALDKAYEALGDELGHRPKPPVRLEIYPREATLAEVSILTEEEIRTSGTIALCKYNRLMITSPKALLRGYNWVDTVVHEYVHYVVNQKTAARVPIWMHEGLAKFLERRWRGPDAYRMSVSSEHLLRERIDANSLITFEQMHPSMAKLPSQEDAAVAFAEVYTAMEYMRKTAGPDAFQELLDRIAKGADAKNAFAAVLNTTFRGFEKDWKKSLATRPKVDFDPDTGFENRLIFRTEKGKKELSKLPQPKARDHMHLGETFHARQRYVAAVVEYQKAVRLAGDHNPVLQTRLAESLIEIGNPAEALSALEKVEVLYPSYVRTWILKGHAYNDLKEHKNALEELKEAARINPFDPAVHEQAARAHQELGENQQAVDARKLLNLVK